MPEQKLFEYKNNIPANNKIDDIKIELETIFVDDYIYSFIIYIKTDESCNVITYYLKHLVSEENKNNTLYYKDVIDSIINSIIDYRNYKGKNRVIGFGQPPIDLMVEIYEPLVDTLAKAIKNNWQHYELDDLKQICRLCMIELYNKGYYIHKRLLKKVFNRKILEEVRGLKKRGDVISIYQRANTNQDGELITIQDLIEDTDEIIKQEELERLEGELAIFKELKEIIIDIIGPRKWDMLFRDYGKGHTTNTTRLMMKRIKEQLKQEGYTRNLFNERYH